MKQIKLLPRDESDMMYGLPCSIDDDYDEGLAYQCQLDNGEFFFASIFDLVNHYKFPFHTDNSEQSEVVDYICRDEIMFGNVEFYYPESITI